MDVKPDSQLNALSIQKQVRVRTKINSQIFGNAAPGGQGAKAQAYQAYSEISQRRQAGCIDA
jgi:hypothetical protein